MNTEYFNQAVPETHRPYAAAEDRYTHHGYRRVGNSGLLLPPLSLGLWYNFGDNRPFDDQRKVLRHAFDHGINHFDLANNYGPPYGSAEENFGRMMRKDFRPYRHEMILSTKAGWDMWPGPNGIYGTRKYVLSSLDESLQRMSVDYVDIFYSHRVDPNTPIAETVGALDTAVRQGKALYVGISSYSAERTSEAAEVARSLGTPLVIHQPSYSLLNRWIEDGLTDVLDELDMGSIGFTVLAQGLLTDKYLGGQHKARATERPTLDAAVLSKENLERIEKLDRIASARGQSLAQMALAWALRTVTSVLVGVSSTAQLDENLAALKNLAFSDEELRQIDALAANTGVNAIWENSSDL